MPIKKYTHPDKLEKYSFWWSEARLVIAAIALFIGGTPPVLALNPISALYGFVGSLLTLSWFISGIAAGYLLYRWHENKRKLFGKEDTKDTVAFFVMVVSGLNLGIAGLFGTNIGMAISQSQFIFVVVGLLYLVSAGYLLMRFNASGKKMF